MSDPITPQSTPPAGIPPASANPAIVDLAARIAAAMIPAIIGVLMTGPMVPPKDGFVPQTPPPPPPPPPPPQPMSGPMASMDAADVFWEGVA